MANFVRSTRSRRSRHVCFAPIASEPSHRSDSTRCADIVVKVPHKIGHLCCARPTPQGAGAEAFLRSFKEPPFFPAVASTAALATGSPDASSDFPRPCIIRLRLLAFPMRTAVRESELSTDGQTWDIPGSDAIHLRVMCS